MSAEHLELFELDDIDDVISKKKEITGKKSSNSPSFFKPKETPTPTTDTSSPTDDSPLGRIGITSKEQTDASSDESSEGNSQSVFQSAELELYGTKPKGASSSPAIVASYKYI